MHTLPPGLRPCRGGRGRPFDAGRAADVPHGYIEEEHLLSGTATAYRDAPAEPGQVGVRAQAAGTPGSASRPSAPASLAAHCLPMERRREDSRPGTPTCTARCTIPATTTPTTSSPRPGRPSPDCSPAPVSSPPASRWPPSGSPPTSTRSTPSPASTTATSSTAASDLPRCSSSPIHPRWTPGRCRSATTCEYRS
jgi:hypothetical protein